MVYFWTKFEDQRKLKYSLLNKGDALDDKGKAHKDHRIEFLVNYFVEQYIQFHEVEIDFTWREDNNECNVGQEEYEELAK